MCHAAAYTVAPILWPLSCLMPATDGLSLLPVQSALLEAGKKSPLGKKVLLSLMLHTRGNTGTSFVPARVYASYVSLRFGQSKQPSRESDLGGNDCRVSGFRNLSFL